MINATPLQVVWRTLAATIGIVMLGTGLIGYFRRPTAPWQRVTLLAGAGLLILPGMLSDVLGLACLAVVWATQSPRVAVAAVGDRVR
jgi:TRAP-type uncharacterized transport system fused permease subunit